MMHGKFVSIRIQLHDTNIHRNKISILVKDKAQKKKVNVITIQMNFEPTCIGELSEESCVNPTISLK